MYIYKTIFIRFRNHEIISNKVGGKTFFFKITGTFEMFLSKRDENIFRQLQVLWLSMRTKVKTIMQPVVATSL